MFPNEGRASSAPHLRSRRGLPPARRDRSAGFAPAGPWAAPRGPSASGLRPEALTTASLTSSLPARPSSRRSISPSYDEGSHVRAPIRPSRPAARGHQPAVPGPPSSPEPGARRAGAGGPAGLAPGLPLGRHDAEALRAAGGPPPRRRRPRPRRLRTHQERWRDPLRAGRFLRPHTYRLCGRHAASQGLCGGAGGVSRRPAPSGRSRHSADAPARRSAHHPAARARAGGARCGRPSAGAAAGRDRTARHHLHRPPDDARLHRRTAGATPGARRRWFPARHQHAGPDPSGCGGHLPSARRGHVVRGHQPHRPVDPRPGGAAGCERRRGGRRSGAARRSAAAAQRAAPLAAACAFRRHHPHRRDPDRRSRQMGHCRGHRVADHRERRSGGVPLAGHQDLLRAARRPLVRRPRPLRPLARHCRNRPAPRVRPHRADGPQGQRAHQRARHAAGARGRHCRLDPAGGGGAARHHRHGRV